MTLLLSDTMKMYNSVLALLLLTLVCVSKAEEENKCGTMQQTNLRKREIYYVVPCGDERYPMMLSLHGLGAKAQVEISRYSQLTKDAQFILVAPQGVWGSWNAPECCGKAKRKNLDEKRFLSEVITHITDLTGRHSGKTLVTGFSNGGFLSMELARTTKIDLVAAASMSGYNYGHNFERSLPVLLHHSLSDSMILSTGCCSGSKCNFGLDQNPQCIPTTTWHKRWAGQNKCKVKKAKKVVHKPSNDYQFECYYHHCQKATVLCHHKLSQHLDWSVASKSFQVEGHIIAFFKDELCKASGGMILNANKKKPKRCRCLNGMKGLYCYVHPNGPRMNFKNN